MLRHNSQGLTELPLHVARDGAHQVQYAPLDRLWVILCVCVCLSFFFPISISLFVASCVFRGGVFFLIYFIYYQSRYIYIYIYNIHISLPTLTAVRPPPPPG